MAYSSFKIKALKDAIKSNALSHSAALLLRHTIWKRSMWALLKGYYKMKYKKHLFYEGHRRPAMLKCETVNSCSYECLFCPYTEMEREKTVMALDVFEKVLKDYTDIGGGLLCLTPAAGDVLLDPFLIERIKVVKKYPEITDLIFTTNAALAHRYDDNDLKWLIENTDAINISVYGLDAKEHQLITKSDDYDKVTENIRRMTGLAADKDNIEFDFRFMVKHRYAEIKEWIYTNFGRKIPYETTNSYGRWGSNPNKKKPLPLEGRWTNPKKNTDQCIIPLVGSMVQANGNVTLCHCIDYNGFKEFSIGDIMEQHLSDMYESTQAKGLWDFEEYDDMPPYCKRCSFHRPFYELPSYLKTRLLY
jgi:radical SAM protein with 4Fe4S-binding SPASM domain